MECYYIVISSAHLSNGHFRNIKGVFRGPLSKNGNKTLRLKELKQREFARNVASKSRKDERKQEKALQRLHKLAELRKETACAPGSGPMFKSTTVTVHDNSNDIPQSAAVDSADIQDFNCTLTHSAQNSKDVASVISSTAENACSNKSNTNKFGDQVQGAQGHKVGFSFAFPKKAVVKLESSAAVFYEYNDEASIEHGFSRKSRFVPGACNLESPSAEIVLCPEEKHNCFYPLVEKCTEAEEAPETQESKQPVSKENRILESPVLIPDVSHSKKPVSSDLDDCNIDVSTTDLPEQTLSIGATNNHVLPLECSSYELLGNRSLAQTAMEDCLSLQDTTGENDKDRNSDSSTIEIEIKQLGADALISSKYEEDNRTPQSKSETRKRPSEPFVPVLSKHGSNILQWPSEMLIYTNTDPSISYSCNPLYFDFKSSKASDSQEKPKHQPNIPHSHYKTESNRSLVLDFTNKSTSECGDYETEMNKGVCNYTIPLLSDVSLIRNCDLAKNQGKMCLDESFRIKKIEKCHISKSHLRQTTVIDEKHNKVRIKESHVKWLCKNRKRKRRRKLCHCHHHHHCRETAKAEMKIPSVPEQEINYEEENKHQHLQKDQEKCRYDAGTIWLTTDEIRQSYQKLGFENKSHKRAIAASAHAYWDRGSCEVWNAKNSNHSTESNHRKSKASSRRQSKQLAQNSRRQNLMYSRAFCSWKVRRSSCSPEQKCLGHCSEEKSLNQNQSIKRSYNFLTDEPEKSHGKRRQRTYSYSSDESLYRQTFLAEEYLRQASTVAARHKAKGKRRRRRARIRHVFIDKDARSETSRPLEENATNSTLNILGELLIQDNIEQTNMDPEVVHGKNTDEIVLPVENKSCLQTDSSHLLEKDKLTECSVVENPLSTFSEVVTHSAASVSEHSVPATASTEDILEDEKKNENVNNHENQAPYKVPITNRNLEQVFPKSFLCHYELAESIPHEKINEVTSEWVRCNSSIFNSPPPLPFKEAHINSHSFLTTEQLIAPFTLPDQALIFPADNHEKFKDLQSEAYQPIMQQNLLTNKVKFAFPPAALQPPSSPLPLPLQQPLCSTSVTTIHHTVLQQHAAAAAAAASTFKVLQPHQQFLSQVPTLSRTPLPHLSVGPRLCPGGHATFVAAPHLPLIPTSVLHPTHLTFPPLPHTVFPSLLSPHPAVIPLQPLF
ncbi:zinc finger protein 804A isoform X2 [Dromaius novaehollandiae]|uniref:Zinc finger protein 804A n=1 Tax=Dromaius novaehollandiae TaxID=8790 RepID=A0A8C4JB48_DRONO|nr:zinc finger protein 804A isoform X1 [Dromaius novaehollandiae]